MPADSADAREIEKLSRDWREKWLVSLESQIFNLHHRRQVHDDLMHLLDAQGHPQKGIFQDFFHGMYIESQAMAIRRQADRGSDTISLRRLIGQLEEHRDKLTREWYINRWMSGRSLNSPDQRERLEAEMHLAHANSAFDKFTDKSGDVCIGRRRLCADRAQLDTIVGRVERYATENIAHTLVDPEAKTVTYGEFNAAIDQLGDMLRRFHLIIDQGGLMSATPVIQGDWKGPFRTPLA